MGKPHRKRNGRWRVTASDFITQLLDERPSLRRSHGYAIPDYLVARGPEVFYARVREIVGSRRRSRVPRRGRNAALPAISGGHGWLWWLRRRSFANQLGFHE